MENEDVKPVELGKIGQIELPQIDIKKYVGKEVEIQRVSTFEGKYGFFVRVETEPVDTIGPDDNQIEIKGSRMFGLQSDPDGKVGWGENTNMGRFMKKMGCDELGQLVGKKVMLQTVTNNNDGKDYLSFN